jgi:hypothetical protein
MILIAEFEGFSEPIAEAHDIEEAHEIWDSISATMASNDDPMPSTIKIWDRNERGRFVIVAQIEVG